VNVVHLTRGEYRDNIDTNSAASRKRFVERIAKLFGADVSTLGWLDQALVDAGDDADRRADEAAGNAENCERKNTADLLVEMALRRYRFACTETGDAFAVEREGPNLAIPFRASRDALRSALAREFRNLHGRTPNGTALSDALTFLAGEAHAVEPELVHLRVTEQKGSIIIDLGDSSGRAVVVQPGDWRVVARSPIVFRRTAATGTLPLPEPGGELDELRAMLNVTPDAWSLVLTWLVAALVPNMPHPILLLGGQQGTGKTTAAAQLVNLVDPSPAPLRSQPRDPEQWAISASASWIVAVDNVSTIPAWWSDSLCKSVTGDGWLRRKLYTDGELAVISFRRVLLLTSIDPGALRGDLGDRILLVDLEPLDEAARSTLRDIETRYEEARPRLFGALLDLLAAAWIKLPKVHLARLPRMADFARLAAAVDCVLPGNCALDVYLDQRERIAEAVIESEPVALAIQALVTAEGWWQGRPAELLAYITPEKPPKDWPRTPRSLSGYVARLTPALDQVGISVEFGPRGRNGRIITLAQKDLHRTVTAVTTSPQAPLGEGGEAGDGHLFAQSSDRCTALAGRLGSMRSDRLEKRPGDSRFKL
jgi:hypothetical protein